MKAVKKAKPRVWLLDGDEAPAVVIDGPCLQQMERCIVIEKATYNSLKEELKAWKKYSFSLARKLKNASLKIERARKKKK